MQVYNQTIKIVKKLASNRLVGPTSTTNCAFLLVMPIDYRLKGQGSPELALEERKKERLTNFNRLLVQTYTIIFMSVNVGLAR